MDPWIGDIEQETLGNDTFRTSSSRVGTRSSPS